MRVLSNMCWEASQKRLERESRASWAKAWRLLLGRALHQGLPGGRALKFDFEEHSVYLYFIIYL